MEAYERLEREWAAFNELPAEGMVACASGTAALHLALESTEIPPGSEVLVPDFTMVACPRAAAAANLKPVFVDCGDDLLITHETLPAAPWSKNAGAVMPVHVYGRRCNVEKAARFADQHKLLVIEDSAEAHGVRSHGGTGAACWSFYKNKVVAGEEGGAVWFRDPAHARRARYLRNLGFTDAHDFMHFPRGWNHRLSNAHAGLILDSLVRYGENLKARREIEGWCEEEATWLWQTGGTIRTMPPREVPWVYDLRVPGQSPQGQDALVKALRDAGIPARHGFKPCSVQPEFFKGAVGRHRHGRTMWDEPAVAGVAGSNALRLSREVIYLPLTPGLLNRAAVRKAFEVIQREISRALDQGQLAP